MDLLELPSTVTLPTPAATQAWGKVLGETFLPGSVVLLQGNLGAGKTSLVQGIGLGLGIDEPIVSPTFTLINEYYDGRVPLYHLDLYRLAPEEVDGLYLEQYWQGEDFPLGIVVIEWPERLLTRPSRYWLITLTQLPQGRQLQLEQVA
jgi:tRNA threonylcarbamoyladenosine biosynthesis protein TsaE